MLVSRPKVSEISSYSNQDYIAFTESEIMEASDCRYTDFSYYMTGLLML
ncbi:hypothetical protein [Okeania sp.]|nr:hypothetical protein [Okeania sp.]MEB3339405.1 hypothetical protein [Okeania sp.]